MKNHSFSLGWISLVLLCLACGHKTRQVAGPEEPVKDFQVEARPRQFENVPANSTVVRLEFIGDSVSVKEVKQGRAELNRFDPGQPDSDVLNGVVKVYRYDILNALGDRLHTGFFRVDPRLESFYPGTGVHKDKVLHETAIAPSTVVTVCLPLDSLQQFQQIRVRPIDYEDGKPIMEETPVQQKVIPPYTILQLNRIKQ